MKSRGEKLEHFVDFILPYVLILLLFIIISEFFFKDFYEHYHNYFLVADWIIIGVFILDLIFKYQKAKTVPEFFKKSWLDIIAVFPFFLVFRVFETVGVIRGTLEAGSEAQKIFHVGLEVEKQLKGAAKVSEEIKIASELQKEAAIIKEVEMAAKEGSRSGRLAEFLRTFFKTPRLFKAAKFYEEPKHRKELENLVNIH